jgi:hypothetical protein
MYICKDFTIFLNKVFYMVIACKMWLELLLINIETNS